MLMSHLHSKPLELDMMCGSETQEETPSATLISSTTKTKTKENTGTSHGLKWDFMISPLCLIKLLQSQESKSFPISDTLKELLKCFTLWLRLKIILHLKLMSS